MFEIRDPLPQPTEAGDQEQFISFYHPAYSGVFSPLVRFLAADDGGFHYQTALIACSIVADNCPLENAWFSSAHDRAKETPKREYSRLREPDDGVLRGRAFFFHVNDGLF